MPVGAPDALIGQAALHALAGSLLGRLRPPTGFDVEFELDGRRDFHSGDPTGWVRHGSSRPTDPGRS